MKCIILAILGTVTLASATEFMDCGSLASDVEFSVEGCDLPPCTLERDRTYVINYKFTASTDTDSLILEASANIGGIEIPWPGIDPDACKQLEGTANPCPIEKGSHVDWTFGAEVLKEYPKVSMMVTFQLVGADGNAQTCASLPAKIV